MKTQKAKRLSVLTMTGLLLVLSNIACENVPKQFTVDSSFKNDPVDGDLQSPTDTVIGGGATQGPQTPDRQPSSDGSTTTTTVPSSNTNPVQLAVATADVEFPQMNIRDGDTTNYFVHIEIINSKAAKLVYSRADGAKTSVELTSEGQILKLNEWLSSSDVFKRENDCDLRESDISVSLNLENGKKETRKLGGITGNCESNDLPSSARRDLFIYLRALYTIRSKSL